MDHAAQHHWYELYTVQPAEYVVRFRMIVLQIVFLFINYVNEGILMVSKTKYVLPHNTSSEKLSSRFFSGFLNNFKFFLFVLENVNKLQDAEYVASMKTYRYNI